MKTIVVNSVAFTEGGSFVILEDFLKSISYRDDISYIVFCSVDEFGFLLPQNVKIINPDAKRWVRRLYWDFIGIKKWCKDNDIRPSLLFSLQSCGSVFFRNVPQVIYYHQPMPIYEQQWSLFSSDERVLWLKKVLLRFVMRLFVTDKTIFITQLKCIKQKVQKTFNVLSHQVKIFYPTIPQDIDSYVINQSDSHKHDDFVIVYPASAMKYKNHVEIVNAIIHLKHHGYSLKHIKVKFAGVTSNDLSQISSLIKIAQVEYNFIFMGYISRAEMLELYSNADLLLFPSYIETFGLPLVEAAKFGIPIGVVDEDYAYEVLTNYNGVTYLPIHNAKAWASYILSIQKLKPRFEPLTSNCFQPSWHELIGYIESEAGASHE